MQLAPKNAKQRTQAWVNAWVASLTRPQRQRTVNSMHQSGDSSHISQRLEVGRKALETLASIASQLENAKDGLVRSSYLTANIEELPPGIRRLWESLDKDVLAMSAQDLMTKLLQLERLLTVRLASVMPMVERICAEDRGEEIKIGGMRAQLQDLSRLASTALAIRLLAHRKHFKFPASQLPISADVLRDKAQRVKKIERVHKLRVITHMKDMVKATTTMLGAPGLDAASKAMLHGVLRDLKSNARHLADGGSFSSLPVPIEEVEMSESDQDESQDSDLRLVEDKPVFEDVAPTAPLQPAPQVQRQSTPQQVPATTQQPTLQKTPPRPQPQRPQGSARVERRATVRTPPVRSAIHQTIKMRPLTPAPNRFVQMWRHLRTWIRAPMGVTWSEARLMMHDEDDL
jgi:hypothetical protein